MSGFVDPAFKEIKVTEPNFMVWRISKFPQENYEAKPVKKEFFGDLHQEDAYIVFNCFPVKKPLGNSFRGAATKMEIHIHFWLGSELSKEERKRATTKAIDLDDVLEGVAVLHREKEGWESNTFLSYFKNGMVIKRGEIASVLRQPNAEVGHKRYDLFQRASTLILKEKPYHPSREYDVEGTEVSETRDKFFVSISSCASREDKFLALQFSKQTEKSKKKKITWLFNGIKREPGNDVAQHEFERFVSAPRSKGKNKSQQILLQNRKDIMLYEVTKNESSNITEYLRDGSLLKSYLDSQGIYIVLHPMSGTWVWVGRKVPKEEKSRAINIGIAFAKEKSRIRFHHLSKMSVTRVVEGKEPAEFKLLFHNWRDDHTYVPSDGPQYFCKKAARPVNVVFSADKLEKFPSLAAETQLMDYGSGTMRISKVSGSELKPVKAEDYGIFHSDSSYLVHYSYVVKGKTHSILYYWLGSRAPPQEKLNSIWSFLKQIPDLTNVRARVRIEQGKETPHFYAIFFGKIIVLTRRLRPSSSDDCLPAEAASTLDQHKVILLKVTGGDAFNTLSLEVEPSASSLNSYHVFLLRTPTLSFIWCGRNSKGDEREMAKEVARKWTTGYKVLLENDEHAEFWSLLGGVTTYSCVKPRSMETQVNVPARAFKCSFDSDFLIACEIINFVQQDLASHEIIIVDSWNVVFVWIGRDVLAEEECQSEELAKAYISSDPSCRDATIPIIQVHQDSEPPVFTGFFPSWDKSSKWVYDEEVKKKLFFNEDVHEVEAVQRT